MSIERTELTAGCGAPLPDWGDPKRGRRRWGVAGKAVWFGAGAAALVVGSLNAGRAGTAVPAPTVTVTVAPPVCVRALGRSERLVGLLGRALVVAGEGFAAFAESDVAGVSRVVGELERSEPVVRAARVEYARAASLCRGGVA